MPQLNSLFRFDSTHEPTSDSSMPEMDTEFTWEDPLGATPLHHACFFSFVGEEKVKELLEAGADPNARDKKGLTALHYLVLSSQGRVEEVKLLLSKGADLSLQDEDGQSVLDYALKAGRHSLILLFLEHGVGLDILESHDLNQLNEQGFSFFHQICLSGDLKRIKEVLNRGGSLATKTSQGQSPLHLTVKRGDQRVLNFLLDEGLEVNEVDLKGQSPLHLACSKEINDYDTANFFLKRGANPELQDQEGNTPHHLSAVGAAYSSDYQIFELFLDLGVDLNLENKEGYTSADVYSLTWPRVHLFFKENMKQQYSFFKKLYESGLDPDRPAFFKVLDRNQMVVSGMEEPRPIHLAMFTNARGCELPFSLLEVLVKNGADVNARDGRGQTPLHWCTELTGIEGALNKMRYLLENGADPRLKDLEGQRPSDLLSSREATFSFDKEKCFKLLKEWELKVSSRPSPK